MAPGTLGGLPLTTIVVQGQRVVQPARQAPEGAAIFLNLQAAGEMVYVQGGTKTSRPGSGFVIDSTLPFELNCPARMTHINVVFPRTLLLDMLQSKAVIAGMQLSRTRFADRLCLDYLSLSLPTDAPIPDDPALATTRLTGLFAYAINSRYGSEPLPREALAAVAFGRASEMIAAQAHDAALSPSRVAQALGMSLRTLERVFRNYDEKPADRILRTRIGLARAKLSDPTHRQVSITDIALDSGFSHPSYFSRAFKRETDMTPRQFRSQF